MCLRRGIVSNVMSSARLNANHYYIANLNIEYTYREMTGRYLEFPNLVFVDTLDNMEWQGATGGPALRGGSLRVVFMSA